MRRRDLLTRLLPALWVLLAALLTAACPGATRRGSRPAGRRDGTGGYRRY